MIDPHARVDCRAHAMRAVESDRLLRAWMAKHPGGTVVSLGEGLDSQSLRVDDGRVQWVTVDVPSALDVRARFIGEAERRRHVAKCALDHSWMDAVDSSRGVFVVAQGLFMYFHEAEIAALIAVMAERFAGGELFFDTIPAWFSAQTLKGAKRTPHYKLPQMPWGIDVDRIEPFLRTCTPKIEAVSTIAYRLPRGWMRALLGAMSAVPVLSDKRPMMVHARFAETTEAS